MKLCLALIICLYPFASLFAEDGNFKLKPLKETQSQDLIKVDAAWLKSPDRIQASLKVASDTDSTSVFAKAYFYDDQNNLIYTYEKPCPIWTRTSKGIEEIGLPATLEKGKETDVYFAVTDELKQKKWKTVLVVFGNDKEVTARSRPQVAYTKLEFAEKSLVKISD